MSAFQNPNGSFLCTTDVGTSVFVTQSGGFSVEESNSGDTPIGISSPNAFVFNQDYAAPSGQPVGVYGEGEEAYLLYGGTVAAGDLLAPDNSGRGVTTDGTASSGAVAIEAGAVGELHRVRVQITPVAAS